MCISYLLLIVTSQELIEVDPAHASRLGVRFCQSRNTVILTPDTVPTETITYYLSLKSLKKYDRKGRPL